jgi:hypothetical protein
MSAYAVVLAFQDDDETGADDEIAVALEVTANAFRRVAAGKAKPDKNAILKLIADSIYQQIGEEPEDA